MNSTTTTTTVTNNDGSIVRVTEIRAQTFHWNWLLLALLLATALAWALRLIFWRKNSN